MTSKGAAASAAVPRGSKSFRLRQLTRLVGQHYDHIVGQAGLKTTQYSLLSSLARLAPIRPGELAGRMDLDASTLARNLRSPVAQGWVEVGPGNDARSRLVELTEAGRTNRSEAQREWKRAQPALNQRLRAARLAELHALLDACLLRMSDNPGDADE